MRYRVSAIGVNFTFQLFLLLCLPLPSVAATLLSPSAPRVSDTLINTVPYTLASGETVFTLATKYHLTLEQLKKLNQFRSFSKPFTQLGAGDEIDIPRTESLFLKSRDLPAPLPARQYEEKLARGLQQGGTVLSGNNTGSAVTRMAHSAVVGEVSNATQQWLDQFGTARVQLNTHDDLSLRGSSVEVLAPLHEGKKSLLFSQLGVRNQDGRNTVNIGVGVRTRHNDWMYGTNTFFDNDITGNNRRMGVGVEAWTDYLKLSANSYFGLTDWHASRDVADYNERPASGYDLRTEAYFPGYPQLGGKLMYEKYRGNEVALFGKDNRQKNPHAVTAGINYTPIPLLTVGAERRAGKGGNRGSSINAQLSYRLGESWQSHLTPSAVASHRTLAGSLYDRVERNNNIVLDYKKQALIHLTLPEKITGGAFEIINITAQTTTQYGLNRIDWDTTSLVAAGGVILLTAQRMTIKLPPYQLIRNNSNIYTLGAIAYDNQGNASNRSTTQIVVTEQSINDVNSTTQVSPPEIPADGVAVSQITVRLNDENSQPVQGMSAQLALNLRFTPDTVSPASSPHLTPLTETAAGVYSSRLTAGFATGDAIIVPSIAEQFLTSVNLKLTANTHAVSPDNSSLSVTPDNIIADGIQSSTLTFTAQDSQHNPVKGLTVTFDVAGVSGVTVSAVTDNNGRYSAQLSGISAGTATVVPVVNGGVIAGVSANIVLMADNNIAAIDLAVTTEGSLADGIATNRVQATVTDRHGDPVSAATVAFEANNGAIITPSVVTDAQGRVVATLTNMNAGVTTVTASAHGQRQQIDTSFVLATPISLVVYRNGMELTTPPVVDDILQAVAKCSPMPCNGIPVSFQWEVESSAGSGMFIAIPGATSETLRVTKNVQKRALRVASH